MIALVIALILGGCTPAPTEAIKLKYNDQNPEMGWSAQHAAKPILREMEEATGGKIEFEEYFGQTLFIICSIYGSTDCTIYKFLLSQAYFKNRYCMTT